MKKIYTLFMVYVIALTTHAQLVINENFTGYSSGNLHGQGSWTSSGGGSDVQVANASPLIYSGYTSGGEYITVASGNNKSSVKPFSQDIATNSDKTIYMSFVVRVSSARKNNVDYTISLQDNTSPTPVNPIQIYIKEVTLSNTDYISFGIGNTSATATWTGNFSYNTTYLVVVRYDIISGADNDRAYLWVNPSLGSEPATSSANASTVSSGESYGSNLHALQVTQTTGTPAAAYDAFRVAANASSSIAWSLLNPAGAPLPVLLTSFNASPDALNNTRLVWNTADEIGIVSYIIEKSMDGRSFTAIGSVAGTGQKTYYFTDAQPGSEYTYYRLRIVETDGTYKFSYIVGVKSKIRLSISLSPNPVKDRLMIMHPKVTTEGHIQIVNVSGQLLKDYRLPAGAVITNVDMSGFANGMYHIVFKSGTDAFTKPLLKQ